MKSITIIVTSFLMLLSGAAPTGAFAEPVRGFAWRISIARADAPGAAVTAIEAGSSYQITVDIVPVKDVANPDANGNAGQYVRIIRDDIAADAKSQIDAGRNYVRRHLVLILDNSHFALAEGIDNVIDLDARKIMKHLGSKPDEGETASVSVEKLTFPVQTRDELPNGRVYLAVAAFDEMMKSVRDEASLAICTVARAQADADCGRLHTVAFGLRGRDASRDWANHDAGSLFGLPDAAITFFQLRQRSPVIGVLTVNRLDGKFDEKPKSEVWLLATQDMANLISNLERMPKRLSGAFDLAREEGEFLYKLLFPPRAGPEVRKRFEAFLAAAAPYAQPFVLLNQSSITVRFVAPSTVAQPPRMIPLGAIWVPVRRSFAHGTTFTTNDEEGLFLGHHFRIELSLDKQQTQTKQQCIGHWQFVGPPGVDTALSDARGAISPTRFGVRLNGDPSFYLQKKGRRLPIRNMTEFRFWVTAPNELPDPVAISIVSHHDENRLFFTAAAYDGFTAADASMKFAKPSFAILNSCETGSANPAKSQIVQDLNFNGIEAMVATIAPVKGELAGQFADCLLASLDEQNGPTTLAELFRSTRACVVDVKNKGRFDAEILKYVFLGNGSLEICASAPEDLPSK